MTMMIMMIIITFCALDILILEFLTCEWQLVWNMLIKFNYILIRYPAQTNIKHLSCNKQPQLGSGYLILRA